MSSFANNRILFQLEGNEELRNILAEIEFWPDRIAVISAIERLKITIDL